MKRRIAVWVLQYRPWVIAIFQACLISCSLVFAWLLRFDFTLPSRRTLGLAIPILFSIRLGVLARFGLLRGWWRYTGRRDILDILLAVSTGSLLFCLFMASLPTSTRFPRSICIMEALLTAGLLVGVRLASRLLAESMREDIATCKRVVLIGAGTAAQTILREISRAGSGYVAVGCVDDNRSKHGIRVQDVPVLGSVGKLSQVLESQPADEVLIAVPSATNAQMRRFVDACTLAKIKFRTVPALKDIIAGRVTVQQLRDVSLEDLLGRDPVQLDLDSVRREITGRSVMVTGAAGSIGSELCRQILGYAPTRLICLDQAETGLFYLRQEILKDPQALLAHFVIADVCDRARMRKVLAENKPDIIFHAAAYKHVPMMEFNVQEAVRNNVLGLVDLLGLAEVAGCVRFVLISSDKAVNPTSVMGASKRICELIISSRPAQRMRCVSVRFGNVLGSSGSVIPVLKQQLQDGLPLTITHPDMKRFFMMIPEAVALVLQVSAIGRHGDILVLNMGEPLRIIDLAHGLIRLSGKSESEVDIQFTGLRDGEKLEEQLFYAHEMALTTSCDKIKRTEGPVCNWIELTRHIEDLRTSLFADGDRPVRAKIKQIVPEYCVPAELPAPPREEKWAAAAAAMASD